MKTKYWENEQMFMINKEIQKMINDKEVKTVVSFSFTGAIGNFSAMLIYK